LLLLDSKKSSSIRTAMLGNPKKITWFLTTPAGVNSGVFELKRLFLAIVQTDFLETKIFCIFKPTLMLNETHPKNYFHLSAARGHQKLFIYLNPSGGS